MPSWPQKVFRFDEVCYDFPDLTIVMMHGAEPWQELAVKLMLKWPGLHYMTSAFAPKHYPKAIIDYTNTRGADKIMYCGYFPAGLTLERQFGDMPNVPFTTRCGRSSCARTRCASSRSPRPSSARRASHSAAASRRAGQPGSLLANHVERVDRRRGREEVPSAFLS